MSNPQEWRGRDVAKFLAYIHEETSLDIFRRQFWIFGPDAGQRCSLSLVEVLEILPWHGEEVFYVLHDGPESYTASYCSYAEYRDIIEESVSSPSGLTVGWDMKEATTVGYKITLVRDILRGDDE
jgi:hypothetical protein